MIQIKTSEEAITISRFDAAEKEQIIAAFEDCGNGMDGEICEPIDYRLEASELIALAEWILSKAKERARDSERA